MLPVLISIGPLTIYSFGLLLTIGLINGIYYVWKHGRLASISEEKILDICFLVILGGLIGARLLYVVSNWGNFSEDLPSILAFWRGGLSFFGALIGGGIALIITARIFRTHLGQLADLTAPAVAIGAAWGYLGALLGGGSYGADTSWWWGLPIQGLAGRHHPSQILEGLLQVIILLILLRIRRRVPFAGFLILAYLVMYCLGRFFLEFLRGDQVRIGFLAQAQILSLIIGVAAAVLIYLRLARLQRSWRIDITELYRMVN